MYNYRTTGLPIPSRRKFLALSATAIISPRFATAGQVSPTDPRILSGRVSIGAAWGKLDCYIAQPNFGANHPGAIVAHDKLGPTRHFEDVARRLAIEGFVALLLDYASRFGGTPSELGPALEVVGMTKVPQMVADTETALLWLQSEGRTSGRIGAVGFGRGATTINSAITKPTNLKAVATFYGHPPPPVEVSNIHIPLLLNFAGKDRFIDAEIPPFIQALKAADIKYELFIYDDTVTGFEDDSTPSHYSAEAAKLAWSRTYAFLKRALG